MRKKKRQLIYNTGITFISILALCFMGCEKENGNVTSESTWIKVYESQNVKEYYYPQDIIQTDDKGYLILSSLIDRDMEADLFFPMIHLTKVDESGAFEWSQRVDNQYLSAVPKLMKAGAKYYILCMKSLNSALLGISLREDEAIIEEAGVDNARPYPLAAFSDGQNIITTSYFDQTSYINSYNLTFNRRWSASEPTGEDIVADIRQHLIKQGREYPFYIGKMNSGNTYFANAFRRSTLALLFVDNGTVSGYLTSFRDEGVISSCANLQGNTFAVSRYYAGDNFVFPGVDIDISAPNSARDYEDDLIAELQSDARVQVMRDEFDGADLILYASTTKANQIALYFYDAETYELVKTHYLGQNNPVEVAAMIRAEDGAIVILGKTWVSGSYQRNILYKIAEDEIGLK